jgi:hypothetical protein
MLALVLFTSLILLSDGLFTSALLWRKSLTMHCGQRVRILVLQLKLKNPKLTHLSIFSHSYDGNDEICLSSVEFKRLSFFLSSHFQRYCFLRDFLAGNFTYIVYCNICYFMKICCCVCFIYTTSLQLVPPLPDGRNFMLSLGLC